MGLSDTMLAAGCALHVEAIHGEQVSIITGLDAGQTFIGVRETVSDITLSEALGPDVRAKRVIRFRETSVPRLSSQDVLQTGDGKKWKAVRAPQDGYQTVDFELVEIVAAKDK